MYNSIKLLFSLKIIMLKKNSTLIDINKFNVKEALKLNLCKLYYFFSSLNLDLGKLIYSNALPSSIKLIAINKEAVSNVAFGQE